MTERSKIHADGIIISAVCGVMYSWSVFILPLEQLFGWSRQAISFTFTLVFISFSAGMFGGGLLSKRLGPRTTY